MSLVRVDAILQPLKKIIAYYSYAVAVEVCCQSQIVGRKRRSSYSSLFVSSEGTSPIRLSEKPEIDEGSKVIAVENP